jgi:hypothetical protein
MNKRTMASGPLHVLAIAAALSGFFALPAFAIVDDGAALVPRVAAGQVLRYDETDRLSGAIKHAHHQLVTFRILNASDTSLTFERTATGKPSRTFTVDFTRAAADENSANFFFPRGFLDGAPGTLATGASWQTRMREESSLGQPGTARFEIVALDRGSGRLTIRGSLRGEGETTDTSPGDTAPTKFRTTTDRTVTVVLTNGIIDSYTVSGDDKQSANGSTPISVHVEMAYRRVK